jgi:TPR repeat protein
MSTMNLSPGAQQVLMKMLVEAFTAASKLFGENFKADDPKLANLVMVTPADVKTTTALTQATTTQTTATPPPPPAILANLNSSRVDLKHTVADTNTNAAAPEGKIVEPKPPASVDLDTGTTETQESQDFEALESAEELWQKEEFEKAFTIYQKLATRSTHAMCRLGEYWQDHAVAEKKDEKKAYEYFLYAAREGHAFAQNRVGLCLEYGRGTEKNVAAAIGWYQKAAWQGHAAAQRNLSICYEEQKNDKKMIFWLTKAAINGHPQAQFRLAGIYEFGQHGVSKDMKRAFEWTQRVTVHYDTTAQKEWIVKSHRALGWYYAKGQGVDKNQALAVMHFEKAAGHFDAYCWLGSLHDPDFDSNKGSNVTLSAEQAYRWYQKCVDEGQACGQCLYYLSFKSSNGVKKNLDLVERATAKGHNQARYKLAMWLKNGNDSMCIKQDLPRAVELLKLAAAQGNEAALREWPLPSPPPVSIPPVSK